MAMLLVKVAVNAAISYGLGLLARSIAGTETVKQEGSRLSEVQITSSTEGSSMKRLWGTSRVGGQIIWATKFKEVKKTDTDEVGGKGGGGQEVQTTTYTYFCSFAIALCEGSSKTQLGRIWIDGKLLDQTKHTIRFYNGSSSQEPDSFIETKEGVGKAPAFRGVAYLMFEEMDLTEYGNRIPQISAELTKPIEAGEDNDLEALAKGWALIPSAGEFVYGTKTYMEEDGKGNSSAINVHNSQNKPNMIVSLDALQALAPATHTVMLVVSWFGSDLRVGYCELKPKIEAAGTKVTYPDAWKVGPITRSTAEAVSTVDGSPAFGGTPADVVVRQAIQNIKDRGWRAVFYPFILVDIAAGNTLPQLDGSGTGQPVYPWRGRITCTDAHRETAFVTSTVADFVGTVDGSDFGDWNEDTQTLSYTGPSSEWSYRRMIFHYAALLKDILGPNDAFIIGSEMVGLTTARSNTAGGFPFVDALVSIAADVKAELGTTKVSYAADWTEYNCYHPDDGSGDLYFHLDPLWASDDIDFVGIDAYFPLSDWREGTAHLDYDEAAGITNPYVAQYLEANIEGGELYDWYYASPSDRTSQTRTAITDGAYSKPWVFRQKDFRNWWANRHYNRPNGTESGSPTAWLAEHKPIWFTEFGCPAVDKGSNQPNVFVDPKSSESYFPYFSTGERDDLIQRRYNQTMLKYWAINGGGGAFGSIGTTFTEYVDSSSYYVAEPGVGSQWIKGFIIEATGHSFDVTGTYGASILGSFGATNCSRTGYNNGFETFTFNTVDMQAIVDIEEPDVPAWDEFKALSDGDYILVWTEDAPGRFFRLRYNAAGSWIDLDPAGSGHVYYAAPRFEFVDEADTSGGFLENMLLWCWDARPYPEFPFRDDVWTDGGNWALGHWMTGRLGAAPLADLVTELCGLVGVTSDQIDVSGLYSSSAVVQGYLVEDIKAPRDMLQDLCVGYSFDGYESGGKLTFNFRANSAQVTLSLDDLVATSDNPGGYSITRAQETDIPSILKLSFIDQENDYNVGGADARTSVGYSQAVHSMALPLVLPQQYVRALGDVIIQEAWLQREVAQFILPRSFVRVDPSDVLNVTIKGRDLAFRVAETETGDVRTIDAVAHDASVYGIVNYSGRAVKPRAAATYGRSKVFFMDVPAASASEPKIFAPRLAVYQDPWPGAVNIFRDDDAGGYKINTQVRTQAKMGELAFDLYSGPLFRWDTVNSVYVDLYDPDASLFGTTELAVLNGANALAVQNQNGGWEVIQYVNALPVSEGRYQLTQLLRGQLGTESEMLAPTDAGGAVVFIDPTTLTVLNLKEAEVGESFTYRYGPAPLPVGDTRYRTEAHTFNAVGLRPYSPVSLEGTWNYATGDITLEWIRRTRLGGDNWNSADVPLNEETEKYSVDIMNGSTVVRTFNVTGDPVKVYTAAQQTTDFGGVQTSLKFRVYQLSAVYGRGSKAEATVYG